MNKTKRALFIFACLLMVPVLIYAVWVSKNKWETFKAEHNCRIVDKLDGSTGTGVGITFSPNGGTGIGPVITSNPAKVGWLCDDGITYWK